MIFEPEKLGKYISISKDFLSSLIVLLKPDGKILIWSRFVKTFSVSSLRSPWTYICRNQAKCNRLIKCVYWIFTPLISINKSNWRRFIRFKWSKETHTFQWKEKLYQNFILDQSKIDCRICGAWIDRLIYSLDFFSLASQGSVCRD